MAALKESRKRRRREDLGVPTWTGKSGTAGAPKMYLMQQQDNERRQAATAKPRFGTANTFNPMVSADPSSSSSSRFGRQAGTGAGFGAGNVTSSSSSLLAGMMERRRLEQGSTAAVHSSSSAASSPSSSVPGSPRRSNRSSPSGSGPGTEGLITKIRDFMMDQGGRVQSTDLVGHFQHQLADVEQLVFKKMLKGIAVLERTPDGTGWWKLKPEYY